MSFIEKQPRRWGDRKDGVWVRNASGLNVIMVNLFPKRTDNEVFLQQDIDVTELLKYIEAKNGPDAPFKTTIFHCFVTMIARVVNERPYLNRFIQGRRIYQRDEITIGFVAKRKFTDHSEEGLMIYTAKAGDTLSDVSRKIIGDVKALRSDNPSKNLVDTMDKFAKLPRPLLMLVIKTLRILDFWGKVPEAAKKGDSNFASVLVSNLGSIRCPSVYHHLNEYGTTSVVITIGAVHKKPLVMPDGSVEMRDVIDIGATLDERIGDGFYFARSLKMFQHICSHPELLDMPLEEDIGYGFV